MNRGRLVIAAAVVVAILLALGSALGWFSAAEAPAPAAIVPEAGGATQ
jgi:hypothetical protein